MLRLKLKKGGKLKRFKKQRNERISEQPLKREWQR